MVNCDRLCCCMDTKSHRGSPALRWMIGRGYFQSVLVVDAMVATQEPNLPALTLSSSNYDLRDRRSIIIEGIEDAYLHETADEDDEA